MNLDRRLLSLARDSRTALIITILAGFLGGILTIAQARALSLTINNIFINGETLQDVMTLLRALLFIIAGRSLLVWISEVSAKAVAVRVKNDLRERLFAHIVTLGPSFTRKERTGELTAAVVEGVEALDAYFSQYLPQLVLSALVPLSILVFAFPIDPLSGLILFLTAPLIPVFMILIGKGAEAITNRQYETLSRLSAHFLDSL
ncbi:MAG: thiol reductant ABC exporter subunit CydD, partial [Anaerolineae bacterium]|nr:thiol reductant ABC exporter subunit CydD [Anaerolineae bacterium]